MQAGRDGMKEFAVPRSDEPFDFRHQAERYGRWRRDYAPALYEAIAARTGPGAGRRALDLGCGTGFVATALAARGWAVVGVDFSAPMLAAARHAIPAAVRLVQARAEALPLRAAAVDLVTSGTAFHWFPPAATHAEVHRVLAPGGWAALFWRYPEPGQAHTAAVRDALRRVGVDLPDDFEHLHVHAPEPFARSGLAAEPEVRIEHVLEFTADSFHGWISTVEWLRRLAGDRHAAFLDALRDELARRHPAAIRERNVEHLFLAQRRATRY
jgi:SAM-dependent methyltransferase